MATRVEPLSFKVVTSPFLRNPEIIEQSREDVPAERRIFRKSLERLERINMNDLEPFSSEGSNHNSSEDRTALKRQNRLSREILGVDDEVLSAPDNARVQQSLHQKESQTETNDSSNRPEIEDDVSSVVFGGSVASTVPDRYGFFGGSQFSNDTEM